MQVTVVEPMLLVSLLAMVPIAHVQLALNMAMDIIALVFYLLFDILILVYLYDNRH